MERRKGEKEEGSKEGRERRRKGSKGGREITRIKVTLLFIMSQIKEEIMICIFQVTGINAVT